MMTAKRETKEFFPNYSEPRWAGKLICWAAEKAGQLAQPLIEVHGLELFESRWTGSHVQTLPDVDQAVAAKVYSFDGPQEPDAIPLIVPEFPK